MNAAKNAVGPSELTPEDAERFAAMFKPIWELDDAPFAANPVASHDAQLAAGISVVLEEPSVVVDIEPDPTPPPLARPQPVQAQPQPPPVRHAQVAPRPTPSKPVTPRKPPPRVVDDLDLAPPKKSNTGLFIGLGLVGLVVAGGIAYVAMRGSPEPAKQSQTTQSTQTKPEEPRIPPPPPLEEAPKVDTKPADSKPADIKPDTKPADIKPDTKPVAAKPVETAKPIDTKPAPKPVMGTTTKPSSTKSGGGGIVRDNPF